MRFARRTGRFIDTGGWCAVFVLDVVSFSKPWRISASSISTVALRRGHWLPGAAHGQIRLRCVTQPDAAQAALLDRLGIALPKRMRPQERQLSALAVSA